VAQRRETVKAFITENNLYVRPETPAEVEAVKQFRQALHEFQGSVFVFLDTEPSTRAMSITPSKEVTIN
jgi:hypothetical protein